MESNESTKEIDFSTKSLPKIKSNQSAKELDTEAKRKLTTSKNRLTDKGRSDKSRNAYKLNKVNYQEIVTEPEVEKINLEYLDALMKKKRVDAAVKEKAVELINKVIDETPHSVAQYFRDACVDVIDVLYGTGTGITLTEYINAVLFVTYRNMGDTKIKAYSKVFPERVMRMQREGQEMANLYSYAEIFSNTKAVVDIQARLLVPVHILCKDYFFQALKVSVDIMNDDRVSPKVRVEAANNIMNQTKQPELKRQELQIAVKDSNEIAQLKDALYSLSKVQQEKISDGVSTVVDVIAQEIYVEDEDDE